jgi:hypothetical protein
VSDLQIIYALWLAGVFIAFRPVFAMWVVLANMLAMLAICGLMDIGVLIRSDATLFIMLVDLVSGVVLALRGGVSRALAWGYAATVCLYSLNIILAVSLDTTFALVYVICFAQLGVLTIGSGGDNGYRNRRRFGASAVSGSISHRNDGLAGVSVALVSRGDGVAE